MEDRNFFYQAFKKDKKNLKIRKFLFKNLKNWYKSKKSKFFLTKIRKEIFFLFVKIVNDIGEWRILGN